MHNPVQQEVHLSVNLRGQLSLQLVPESVELAGLRPTPRILGCGIARVQSLQDLVTLTCDPFPDTGCVRRLH